MSLSRRNRAALILAALALLALAWVITPARNDSAAVRFTLINGERLTLAALRGRPVLLVFWATTCAPCVREAADLAALYRAWQPRGFELIAVAMRYDAPARVLAFKESQQLPYRVALDLDGAVAAYFQVEAIPRALLLDADGKIVLDKLGMLEMAAVRTQIETLLRAK